MTRRTRDIEVDTPDPSARMVRDIWPWIPAFKAVAETEHLPTAAVRLHVTPSALSRTVRLIEETVGQPLFLRTARRLILNPTGKRLLATVQRATATLEEALPGVLGPDHEGELRVSSLGVLTDRFVLPALLDIVLGRPALVPCLTTLQSREANRQIANGQIEVAFYYDATAQAGVRCERLGSVSSAVYCGEGHPLFGKRNVTREKLLAHPFSAAALGDRGTRMDGWPVDVRRKVGFQITMLSTNLVVALSGRYLAVLPEVVARPHVEGGRLFLHSAMSIPDVDVFAAMREEGAPPAVVDLVANVAARVKKELGAPA